MYSKNSECPRFARFLFSLGLGDWVLTTMFWVLIVQHLPHVAFHQAVFIQVLPCAAGSIFVVDDELVGHHLLVDDVLHEHAVVVFHAVVVELVWTCP